MTSPVPHIHDVERRLLTVVFVDIVKSSQILRRMDVEAAEQIFREVITRQIDICSAAGGTVNQVMGDGLMCLFGAEAPREDHALQAMTAAEKMLEDIAAVREKLGHKSLRIRIGVNSGEVILRPPAKPEYQSRYQVVGEAVHVTDRVTKTAAPDSALYSESSRRLLERFCLFEKGGAIRWGAKGQSIALYKKTGPVPRQQELTGEIVRADEAAGILAHVTTLRENLAITWIQGDAGFGKTCVTQYVRAAASESFDREVMINFYPHPVSGTNRLKSAIAAALLPVSRQDWPDFIRGNADLARLGDTDFVTACLDEILDVRGKLHPDYHGLDKSGRAQLRRAAVAALLRHRAGRKPLLLIIEDLHWARREELGIIENTLKDCVAGVKLSVICTSRERFAFSPALAAATTFFTLRPLAMEQSLQLLNQSRQGKPIPAVLARTVCQLSGGNPYFIREYGQWVRAELKRHVPSQEISRNLRGYTPEEIVNLLFSKLKNLDRATIDLARTASVQGMKVDAHMLARLAGTTQDAAQRAINDLVAEGILRTDADPNDSPVFVHELLQKVIYNSLPRSGRLQLHLAALRYLRLSGRGSRLDARRLMAYHADCAEDPVRQYIFSKWAGREAARLSQHADALDFFTAAKRAVGRLKGFRAERHLLKIHVMEIESLFILGRYPLVKNRLQHVLARKALFPGQGMLRGAMSFNGLYLWINGEIREAERTYAAILKTSPQSDQETYMRESARLSHICIDLGEYEKAVVHAGNVLALLGKENLYAKCGLLTEMGPTIYSCLALASAERGDAEGAKRHIASGTSLLSGSRDYFTRIYAGVFLAASHLRLEQFEEAKPLLESALDTCDVVQSVLLKPYALSAYGYTIARLGDVAEGEKHCASAIELAKESRLPLRRALFNIRHAQTLMLGGKTGEAMKLLRRAVKSAVAAGEAGQLATAHRLIAECYGALPAAGALQRKNEKYFARNPGEESVRSRKTA
ncbi:MAG TPA: adenylate/guanylate cyclase domain-containing protein [Patescibacteria group bacterium]|nr:adenylate/guanylate cyclase domain-containing protein [Patescibacteria group bacterium]